MEVQSITERIIEYADIELKKEIEAASKPLDEFLRNGTNHRVRVLGATKDNAGEGEIVDVIWFHAMTALRTQAFELNKKARRDVAIRTFMQKVEGLGKGGSL